jgi:hypothetical protein
MADDIFYFKRVAMVKVMLVDHGGKKRSFKARLFDAVPPTRKPLKQ